METAPTTAQDDNAKPREKCAIAAQLAVRFESSGLTLRQMSKLSGVPRDTVRRLLGARIPQALVDLERIAQALGGSIVFQKDDGH